MAVPNTTTFTLQNVVDEVNPTTDDLVDCFADATSSSFDSNYSGDKNNLLNFRNYGGEQYWDYAAGTQSTLTNICSLSLTEIIYQQHPTVQAFDFNDPIYSDTSGTLAPAGWWKVSILYRYWTGSAWAGSTLSC
tara:strand:+ start:41 stop:442 length:402 start_codon:yes stop_codon:yes gene_type:complete